MHPLWGPIKKVDRAQQHLKTLTDEIDGFVEPNRHGRYGAVIHHRNPKTGKYPLHAVTSTEDVPPLRWALLIGEIAYNLRSALDHVACQLALTNASLATDIADLFDVTSFPVYLHSAKSHAPRRDRWAATDRRWLKYMSAAHIARLELFQPYHRRKEDGFWGQPLPAGRRHPLWLLHELNNADKHRLLQVTARVAHGMSVAVRQAPPGFAIKSVYPRLGGELVNGAYVGAIDIEGDWKDVEVYLGLTPQVVFWSGCAAVKGLPVAPTLQAIFDHVRYRILVPLAKEFPPMASPFYPPE